MKRVVVVALAWALSTSAMAQCNPIGWRLVQDRLISISERMCVYEKNGATMTIMVPGLCPFSPC